MGSQAAITSSNETKMFHHIAVKKDLSKLEQTFQKSN